MTKNDDNSFRCVAGRVVAPARENPARRRSLGEDEPWKRGRGGREEGKQIKITRAKEGRARNRRKSVTVRAGRAARDGHVRNFVPLAQSRNRVSAHRPLANLYVFLTIARNSEID